MNLFIITLQFLSCFISLTLQQSTVTYDGYGTFTNSSPFSDPIYRPNANLPQNPSFINTRFYIYSSLKFDNGTIITSTEQSKYFIPNKKTVFIVHGWTQNAFVDWILKMKDAFLSVENINIVTLDWSQGAKGEYKQAIANSQIAGIDLGNLINLYVLKGILSYDLVHIVGHSLGAHVAGFAGDRTTVKISQITGLDPAGPEFDGMSYLVRLDPTDANFVDIIHSDAEILYPYIFGAGIQTTSGHVDFWPNGGRSQPSNAYN